jgi:hypothetical protein
LKFDEAGGAVEMKENIQHSTFNVQRRRMRHGGRLVGFWALNVECSVFLFFVVFALSAFGQGHTNALPALAPPYGELPPTFWEQHGASILIVGFLLVLLTVLFVWKMLQPRSPVILPPEVRARTALAKLLHQPEDGKCLSEISQILRRYVAAAFEFPPGEMTTAEFCAALASHEKIGAELAQAVSSFLRECDARKFSQTASTAPLNAASRALEMVEWAGKSHEKLKAVK